MRFLRWQPLLDVCDSGLRDMSLLKRDSSDAGDHFATEPASKADEGMSQELLMATMCSRLQLATLLLHCAFVDFSSDPPVR